MSDFFKNVINDCKRKIPLIGRRKEIINNADIEHAKIAVEAILEVAIQDKTPVYIVTENLRTEFYSDNALVEKLKTVLENGIKVNVLLLNSTVELTGNSFADTIKEHASTGAIYKACSEYTHSPHFMLTGDRVFRLETNHEQAKAIISFNNDKIGKCLMAEFERLKSAQDVVKII